jgi:hypothetical protein
MKVETRLMSYVHKKEEIFSLDESQGLVRNTTNWRRPARFKFVDVYNWIFKIVSIAQAAENRAKLQYAHNKYFLWLDILVQKLKNWQSVKVILH